MNSLIPSGAAATYRPLFTTSVIVGLVVTLGLSGPVDAGTTGGCCQCDGQNSSCTIETSTACQIMEGLFLGPDSTCQTEVTISSNPNLSIPDDNPTGVVDTITVAEDFDVAGLTIDLQITHTWIGDLCVQLSKGGGAPVTLIQRMGFAGPCNATGCCGCSSNDLDITLDDSAPAPIDQQCNIIGGLLTGTYSPDESLNPFVGVPASGNYHLWVNDNSGGSVGTLVSWSLVFTPADGGPSPCEQAFPEQCTPQPSCQADINGDGVVNSSDLAIVLGAWGPCKQ